MYGENEQDWTVLKDFKKDKKVKLKKKIEEWKKLLKEFKVRKAKESKELEKLHKQDSQILDSQGLNSQTMSPESFSAENLGMTLLEFQKLYVEKDKKIKLLNDLEDDINKAEKDIVEYEADVATLTVELAEIEEKIKAIRAKKHAKQKAHKDSGKKGKVVESCPLRCKISDITVECSHKRIMSVPPYEEGGDIPTLHVVSGSNDANQDIVTVKMGGSCDHGKKQSADDNKEYKKVERLEGNDQYCPNTKIVGSNNDVNVHRPTGVQFNAATKFDAKNITPVYLLLKRLVFGNVDDKTEYDISFSSCKGNHPYLAKVIAHPKEVWDLKFGFGYKTTYETQSSKRQFGMRKQVQSYDAMTCNGRWEAALEGSYTYDTLKETVKTTLTLKDLAKELQGTKWNYLTKLVDFFDPLVGFFENAIGYSEGADQQYQKTKAKAEKKGKTVGSESAVGSKLKVEFEGPTIKIGGNYGNVERKESITELDGRKLSAPYYPVGGQGELSVGFDPLLKITGSIDILQLLLCTLGGPLGAFLRKVSNMSMGTKDQYGELDKTKSYIETNLSLQIGLTSSIAGNLVFECTKEKGWNASEKTSIGGFVGFILTGKAAVDGQGKALCFTVKFGAGAEFKTTDESGGKESGIEVNYKPTMVGDKFNWAGEFIFNGLSIVWVVYANGGVDGAERENGRNESRGSRFAGATVSNDNPKKEHSDKVDIFKKRALFAKDDVGSVNA